MRTLIFATNNQHKIAEIKNAIGDHFSIITLTEAGIDINIPEPYNTLEENAVEKSTVIHKLTSQDCFSEDTGLEVTALNNEPGVRSARYAGEYASSEENIDNLLKKIETVSDRSAQFRTVISLILNNQQFLFEGICKGCIADSRKGVNGFGYDSVFIPNGTDKTFAEMDIIEKNIYSHRKKASNKLSNFLINSYIC